MSLSRITVSLIVMMIFVLSVMFAVSNMPLNSGGNSSAQTVLPTPQITTGPAVSTAGTVSSSPSPVPPDTTPITVATPGTPLPEPVSPSSSPVPPVTTVPVVATTSTPVITIRPATVTEDQALNDALAILRDSGVTNVQPSGIVRLGQQVLNAQENNPQVSWRFLVTGVRLGASHRFILAIDAYDGHVISFTES